MSKIIQWRDREIDFIFRYIEMNKQPPGVIGFSFLVEAINQLLCTFSLGGGCGEAVGVQIFITHVHITHTPQILGFLGCGRSNRSYGSHFVYSKVSNGVKTAPSSAGIYDLCYFIYTLPFSYSLINSLKSPPLTHPTHQLTQLTQSLNSPNQLTHSPTQSLTLSRTHALTMHAFIHYIRSLIFIYGRL